MPFYRSSPSKQTLNDFDEQLSLPLAIEDTPRIVRDHGLREAHALPLVSRGRAYGWRMTRRPARIAWLYWPEIELRTPSSFPTLVLDCDSEPEHYLAVAFGSGLVCPPNWITHTLSGHGHAVYTLDRPVLRGEKSRLRPLRLLARIAEYYRVAYGADSGYVGLLTHNPTHARYRDSTTWWREDPWTLAELAAVIPKGWRMPAKPTTPEGRNVSLFRLGMRWCGYPANWGNIEGVEAVIEAANAALDLPLYAGEVHDIVKSVIKISRKNLASGQTQQQFGFIQAARGRKSGEARRRGTPLELEPAPWDSEGVSRRTWYDHRAGKHTGQHGGSRR